MKYPLALLAGVLLIAGCSSDPNAPVTPPSAGVGNTAIKYSQWTDQQLEAKAASLKRDLTRSTDSGDESMGAAVFGKMARDDKQEELEGVQSELMRRDPSGGLLEQSNKM